MKLISLLLVLLLTACQNNNEVSALTQSPETSEMEKQQKQPENLKQKQLNFKGVVQLIKLEGGFYGIITEQGDKLLPLNLNPEYLQDGAEIEFSGTFENVMSIQQWGKPFRVTEVKLIKAGNSKPLSVEM